MGLAPDGASRLDALPEPSQSSGTFRSISESETRRALPQGTNLTPAWPATEVKALGVHETRTF